SMSPRRPDDQSQGTDPPEEPEDPTHPGYSDLESSVAHSAEVDDDIYGENDYPPEDESYQGSLSESAEGASLSNRTATGRKPVGNTRVSDGSLMDLEEGQVPGERTRAGPPIKLDIIEGPDAGRSRRFSGVRMVVGRITDCELKLSDQSVSRKHLELVKGAQGVLLRDLGSGNGTKVNGEKVAEKQLQDGDEIVLGKTKIRFVDEVVQFRKLREAADKKDNDAVAEAAAAADRAEAERRAPEAAGVSASQPVGGGAGARDAWARIPASWKKIGGAGLAALVGTIVLLLWNSGEKDTRRELADSQLIIAKKALAAGQWDLALASAQRAQGIFPGIDKTNLAGQARQEIAAELTLKKVSTLIAQKRFGDARSELQTVASGGAPARAKKLEELSAELDARNDDYLYEQAKRALQLRELSTAQEIISGLSPGRQRELMTHLQELRGRLERPPEAPPPPPSPALVRKITEQQQKKHMQAQNHLYEEQAFASVARKFHAGDFTRATIECDRVAEQFAEDPSVRARATELKALIPQFARNYEDGQRKFKAGALEGSVRPLRKALELYEDIGFTGALGSLIQEELAQAALAAAKTSFARGDYASAAAGFREALKLAPNEERAKEGLQRLAETAEDLYTQGYVVRDSDPRLAVAKFKLVLDISSAGSSVYQKAKEQLASMQP
ncbi:MAG: FHA domain-containing protein, partial [Myxococcaceae bacterium]